MANTTFNGQSDLKTVLNKFLLPQELEQSPLI